MDCYIVDKDFNWTFVYTHETMSIILDHFLNL